MNYSVILVVASVAIASATGTLLRCSEQSFDGLGGVLPSSSSGSKFSICSGGLVHEIACPSGQAFDVSSRTCLISHNSNERFIVKSSRQFEDLCTNPNEVQILPNPTNCSQYIICFGLVPIEQSCGYGLLFNPELEVCDIPTNVVCGYSCPNVDDPYNPVWLPDARLEDCSRHYLCFQGNPIQFFCSNNLYFDVVSNTCTYPQYSGCSVPGVWCNTNGTEVVENPRSCTSYYECLEGFPHFRSCPDGEYFSLQMGRCVVGACPPQPGTTTTIEPTSTVDWNTATPSITSTVDWNTSTSSSMSTLIISTTSSGFPSTEQTTTELPSTPTLSTPEITSRETTTDNPNTSSTPSSTITTTGMETTNIATTIETSSSTTDELSTTVVPSTDTTANTEASTTTVEPVSTTDPATTITDVATTTELVTPTETSSTSEIMSTSEATTPSTTESATPTDIITTTEALQTTDSITITESTSTPEVTPPIESTTTAEVTTPTTEAVTTTIEATTTTTTELTTTTEVTTTEIVTTTTEPTTTIDPSVFCQGINSGVFPYPGNCYQYILCLNSLGIVSECAVNQIFNPAQGTCVPGDRDTCILA